MSFASDIFGGGQGRMQKSGRLYGPTIMGGAEERASANGIYYVPFIIRSGEVYDGMSFSHSGAVSAVLGVYDSDGASGSPGARLAITAELSPTVSATTIDSFSGSVTITSDSLARRLVYLAICCDTSNSVSAIRTNGVSLLEEYEIGTSHLSHRPVYLQSRPYDGLLPVSAAPTSGQDLVPYIKLRMD